MKDIAINLNDYSLNFVDGDLTMCEDIYFVEQNLKIRLSTFYGEWFRDITKGVRYFEDILVKSPNISKIVALLKSEILGAKYINSIVDFNYVYNPTKRSFIINFTVDTIFGNLTVNNFSL
jgi:hypothetical protein